MIDISEKEFESNIEKGLVNSGYLKRDSGDYDPVSCLDKELVISFIRKTQPEMWQKLGMQYGSAIEEKFLKRLVSQLERRGTLDVLRRGVTDLGCKFELAYFKPETTMNEEHRRLYESNIFSIIRQVHFSQRHTLKSIDTVLFLNGIPIITAELKNPLTGQNVINAIIQYQKDRDPKEPLLRLNRCLVHFAVDPDLVYFTTHLKGNFTRFFPFNKGRDKGAGNPDNPQGYKTSYLWEELWQKDSLLEIISQYLQVIEELDDNGKKTGKKALIFPRYHQIDSVRELIAHSKQNGPGHQYLIMHSAGSGKTFSISWLSHQLSGLHDNQDKRVFDSILVITDRRVLDWQLQRCIEQFAQVRGVVRSIKKHKARTLADALATGTDIIITTLQTFPFTIDQISSIPGKRFAVIIDEAHSSQSGEGIKAVKKVLSSNNLENAEAEDGSFEDSEDQINRKIEEEMRLRGKLSHVSYFAFTATPKNKTLELFGTPTPHGDFEPFSLYSMKQAIEEKFILDVLQNYTTFKVYFSLLKKIEDDPQYEKKKALSLLKSYVGLHEHAINKKTKIIIEHFWSQVRHRIGEAAKAMLVTRSRLHAVRYKLAFDKYIKEQGYEFKTIVAFSGTVKDPDSGQEFTESGMNGFPDTMTAENFNQNQYRIMIVANKYQTGFDQPLLHTMYVDKKLGSVNAVQTLSRLNRTHPNKEETMVLDFANEAEEIQKSFQPYYEKAILTEATDPNKFYDYQYELEDYHIYTRSDVDAFALAYFSKNGTQEKLHAVLDPLVNRYRDLPEDEKVQFKKTFKNYVRLYAFLSQIITFTDAELEKLYQFGRFLLKKFPYTKDRLPLEVLEKIDMDSYRIKQTSSGEIKLIDTDGELKPMHGFGSGQLREVEKESLSEIIKFINEHFGTEFTEKDKVTQFVGDIEKRLISNSSLIRAADPSINTKENFRIKFEEFFDDTLDGMIDTNIELYGKIVDNEEFGNLIKEAIFTRIYDQLSQESG